MKKVLEILTILFAIISIIGAILAIYRKLNNIGMIIIPMIFSLVLSSINISLSIKK